MKKIAKKMIHQLLIVLFIPVLLTGCELNAIDPISNQLPAPNAYTLPRAVFMGTTVKISGSFIVKTDSGFIYLRPVTDPSGAKDVKVVIPPYGITDWTVSFKVPSPDSIAEGRYFLVVKRGNTTFTIKRTLTSMSPYVNESFNRTPIPGDDMIVSNCVIDNSSTTYFGVGDELVLKGIGFSTTDSLYFNPQSSSPRVAPYKVTPTSAHFIVPAGVTAGSPTLRFSNMPIYSNQTGYNPSYLRLNGITFAAPITTVSNVTLPSGSVAANGSVTITGTGFASGDKVVLRVDSVSETIPVNTAALPALNFTLPASYAGKTFQVLLSRTGFPLLSLGFLTTDNTKQNTQLGNVILPQYLPSGFENKALSFLIQGNGFVAGDVFVMGTTVLTTTTLTATSVLVTTPAANTTAGTIPVYLRRGSHPDELIGNVTVISAPRKFEYAQGGIVYWLDVTNPVAGLVCHVKDAISSRDITDAQLSKTIYGIRNDSTGQYLPASSLNQSIGSGAANTQSILSIQKGNARAAIFCDTLSVTMNNVTYNDWFIPSINELVEMFKVRSSINTAATASGRGGEAFNAQGTSTQSSPSKTLISGYMSSSAFTFSRIWALNFQNDSQIPTAYPILNYFRLRPVRAYNLAPQN